MSEEEESKLPLLKWDVDTNVEGGVIWPRVSSESPPENHVDSWCYLPAPLFPVRQPGYATTKQKAPSQSPIYEPIWGKMIPGAIKDPVGELDYLRGFVERFPDRQVRSTCGTISSVMTCSQPPASSSS